MKCISSAILCSAALAFVAVEQASAVPVPTSANLGKELAPFVQKVEQEAQQAAASTAKNVKPTMQDLFHDDSFYNHEASVAGQGRK